MFVGEKASDSVTSTVAYNTATEPKEYFQLFRDAITLLDKSVAACRAHGGDPQDKKRDAALNLLLGYGMLTMSESRALIALLSIGLERSSRIHFRSLHEYAFRAGLLVENPETAHNFKISAAREIDRFVKAFGVPETDPAVVEAKARYLADADPGQEPQREKNVLGGDMASLMKAKFGGDSYYLSSFGYPSLFAHGSILALYEISEATKGKGDDFVAHIFCDGQTSLMLLRSTSQLLNLSIQLVKYFGVGVLDEWDGLSTRSEQLAKRDGHV